MNRLGLFKGLFVFIKIKLNSTSNIKIGGIKHPIHLRSNTSDIFVFEQVLVESEYDLKLQLNPAFIIDAGANIGLASIYFKNKYPQARIVAIEPDAENFDMLKKNTQLYSGIHLINKGLWNKITFTKISDKYNLGKWSLVIEETTDAAAGLETITIDKIMADYSVEKIDLLKIDIETAEQYLFQDNYQSWLSKTKVIVIELHDWMEKGTAQPFFMAITSTFKKFSYYQSGENTIVVNEDL